MSRRRGRKLGTFQIMSTDGSGTVLANVDYYLDSSDGWFFTMFEDEHRLQFQSPARDQLEKVLKDYFRSRHAIEYEPYIKVEIPDVFMDDGDVVGVKFCLLMISKTKVYTYGNKQGWVEKGGYFDEEGIPKPRIDDRGSRVRESLEGLVPYTPERWTTLERIQAAIVEMRKKLDEVLAKPAMLDAIGNDGLLALAPVPSKKKGKNHGTS